MAKTVFDIKNSYTNMFSPFSSVFAFKQAKETNFVSGVTFDNIFFLFAHFRVTFQIFWGPATKERSNIKNWNFGIGVLQQFGTTKNV